MLLAKNFLENEPKFFTGFDSKTTAMSIHLAAMVVTVAPIMAVFPFFQKYFVKGIMLGSVIG